MPGDEEWLSAPKAADLLGLHLHTLHALIDRGELTAEVVAPTRPRGRRSIRLRRQDVEDFLERARVKPGELRHLHPSWTWERYGCAGSSFTAAGPLPSPNARPPASSR